MARQPETNNGELVQSIGRDAERMARAKSKKRHGIWFGLGMMGLIGWSVAVPTLLGIALGIWLDDSWPQRFSWKIALLFAGVIVGSINAWWWIKRVGAEQ